MDARRKLQLGSLQAGIREALHLQEVGYESRGHWNLAQCCGHLNQWLSFPMDGYPQPGVLMGGVFWLVRHSIGGWQLRSVMRNGFSAGLPTMPSTVPSVNEGTDDEAVAALSRTVERFEAFDQTIQPSPLFGAMDKAVAEQLQLRHFEHHLGFLWPNE